MNRMILGLMLVLGLASGAGAQQMQAAQPVRITVPLKVSCSSVTIGVTPVEVTGNTNVSSTTVAAFTVAVLNWATTNTVYCGDSATVSSSGNSIGWPIPYSPASGQRAWQSWSISTLQPWYCVSSGANTSIEVCKDR